MKPRLAPLRRTLDDWDIWSRLEIMDTLHWTRTMDLIESVDRRDADLMLKLLRTRTGTIADHLLRAAYGLDTEDIQALVSGWINA